jgi:hypothetical protein
MKGHRPFPPYLPRSIIIPLIFPYLGLDIEFAKLGRVVRCLVGSVDHLFRLGGQRHIP